MASFGNKGRMMIRKRAAPNFLAKKSSTEINTSPKVEIKDQNPEFVDSLNKVVSKESLSVEEPPSKQLKLSDYSLLENDVIIATEQSGQLGRSEDLCKKNDNNIKSDVSVVTTEQTCHGNVCKPISDESFVETEIADISSSLEMNDNRYNQLSKQKMSQENVSNSDDRGNINSLVKENAVLNDNEDSNKLVKPFANNKVIKRRIGPKLLSKSVNKVPNSSTNDTENKIIPEQIINNLPETLASQSNEQNEKLKIENVDSNVSVSSKFSDSVQFENSIEKRIEDKLVEAFTAEQCVPSQSVSLETNHEDNSGESLKDKKEGVVRVYLNCWPRYPLSDLSEDPVFADKNVEELGKVCVFTERKHCIAYCDMKTTVHFKDVPKNWAYVNFNKLIKEEFVEPEDSDEEVQVSANENLSSDIDGFDKCDSFPIQQLDLSYTESELLAPATTEINNTSEIPLPEQNEIIFANSDTVLPNPYHNSTSEIGGEVDETSYFDSQEINSSCVYNTDPDLPVPLRNSRNSVSAPQGELCDELVESTNSVDTIKTSESNNTDTSTKIIRKKKCDNKDVFNERGKAENSEELVSDTARTETSTKPYKLRQKKPLNVNNFDDLSGDEAIKDIFSNSEDSDVSEYLVENENKIKCQKSTKRVKKCRNKVRKVKAKKCKEEKKDKKPKEKVEKTKKNLTEKASPYQKLVMEVKNKNKWDEEGNCAEPEKLELKDYIFYVPKNEPMSQELKKELKTKENDEPKEEGGVDEKEEDIDNVEESNHGPKLIVKDGKIIVDPNSTKIKQTPIFHPKIEKVEKFKEPNDPWELQETMKFYGTLWKYGIDFSILAGTFPKKSRDSIKRKFHYEEKNNNLLLAKTLTKKLSLEAVLRELILIDSLEKISRKKCSSNKPAKEPRKQTSKHCLLPRKKKKRPNENENNGHADDFNISSLYFEDNSCTSVQSFISENEIIISDDVKTINMKDIITFSTNVVYKDMNIVESVSFHPSAIQPVDINVTIRHEPEDETYISDSHSVTQDTSLK